MVYNPGNGGAALRDRPSAEEDDQMIHELDDVILGCDLPEHGLARAA